MSENLRNLLQRRSLSEGLLNDLEKGGKSPAELASGYGLGPANVLGTSSFYDLLKADNKNKKIHVCSGSACFLAGTQQDLRKEIGKFLPENEIGELCCLGRCHENSAFRYNGTNYSGCSPEDVENIIRGDRTDGYDLYHSESDLAEPVLMSWQQEFSDLKPLIKSALHQNPEVLLDELKQSMLRGRGGAGFPVWIKTEACRNAPGDQKYIVCNADEGDPGSYSDRFLMEHRPHHILFGMYIAGYLTGADTGVVYVRAEYPESIKILSSACEEWNTMTPDHPDTGFRFRFEVVEGAGSYVVGEETALLSSIEGQRPEVRTRPPYPVAHGLFGCPTLVNNVETFANLPYIIEHGGAAYARLGTEKTKGTKLISLDGHFNRPGVYEVIMGTDLNHVIHGMGEGFRENIKALHIGGPLGGIVPAHMFGELTIDFESFRSAGFELGHGSVIAVPEGFPMIDYLRHLFHFVSEESCGKCFPCRMGSAKGLQLIDLALKGRPVDRMLFADLLQTLKDGSLCAMGSGLTTPVRNILKYFGEELNPYFK